jgi:gamma-glutamylcyclotransferase (GGCT)/AIG2-like uncharacterized protein YtfP
MNDKRMIERGVTFTKKEKGTLKGYRFIINKKSKKDNSIGFANIIEDYISEVEGIVYEINNADILKLDKYEGVPLHYRREIHNINNYDCIVYIANNNWISSNELNTTQEYKNHILEGKTFLSEEYFNKLLEIKTK